MKTLALPERFKWLKDSGYLANLLERGDIPLSHSDRLTGGLRYTTLICSARCPCDSVIRREL